MNPLLLSLILVSTSLNASDFNELASAAPLQEEEYAETPIAAFYNQTKKELYKNIKAFREKTKKAPEINKGEKATELKNATAPTYNATAPIYNEDRYASQRAVNNAFNRFFSACGLGFLSSKK